MNTEQAYQEMQAAGVDWTRTAIYDEEGVDAIRFTQESYNREETVAGDDVAECWEQVRDSFQD